MRTLTLFFSAVLLSVSPLFAEQKKSEPIKEFEVIAEFGVVKTVYMSPAGLKDKNYVAQALHSIMRKHDQRKPIQVMFFNSRRHTPVGMPMTDDQMLHQRAQYNKNPNTGFEEFVWVTVKNSKVSPPDMKHTKANIRPGYAE